MELELRILLISVVTLGSVFFIILFRRNAVPAFTCIWLLVPKLGTNLFGIYEIPLFSFVEMACSLTLLVVVLGVSRNSKLLTLQSYSARSLMQLEIFVIAFFILVSAQQVVSSMFFLYARDLGSPIPPGRVFVGIVKDFSSIVFLVACYKLIFTMKQVERCLLIFIFVLIILAAELAAVTWIGPVKNFIGKYSFDGFGRFNSIFINDYNLFGLVCAVGGLSALHFFRKNIRGVWILLFLIATLLVIFNLKRNMIFAYFSGAVVFWYAGYFQRWSFWKRVMLIVTTAVSILLLNFSQLNLPGIDARDYIENEYISKRVANYANLDSIKVRKGIQLRAFEVIVDKFPFGVGNNMLRYHMGANSPQIFKISDSVVLDGYNRVANGNVVTEAHNGYMEFIASYGLLGFFALLLLISTIARNLLKARFTLHSQDSLYPLGLSISVLFGIYYLFLGYPQFYLVVFLLLHLSFLLARESYGKNLTWSNRLIPPS